MVFAANNSFLGSSKAVFDFEGHSIDLSATPLPRALLGLQCISGGGRGGQRGQNNQLMWPLVHLEQGALLIHQLGNIPTIAAITSK